MTNAHGERPHHLRFYLVLTTLVVVGILVLLLLNDSDGFSLTSAMIGVIQNDTQEDEFFDPNPNDDLAGQKLQNSNEIEVQLTFDNIPTVRKEARIKDIELKFDDLTTKINVNTDRLELNNLQEVTLRIHEFSGNIDLDKVGFSLDGKARGIELNDIALLSKGEIAISFDNLNYEFLSLEEIELKDLELPPGNGELRMGEKLTYTLEQDQLTMYYFNGKTVIDRQQDNTLTLEGVARGITSSGALLDLSVS